MRFLERLPRRADRDPKKQAHIISCKDVPAQDKHKRLALSFNDDRETACVGVSSDRIGHHGFPGALCIGSRHHVQSSSFNGRAKTWSALAGVCLSLRVRHCFLEFLGSLMLALWRALHFAFACKTLSSDMRAPCLEARYQSPQRHQSYCNGCGLPGNF